MKVEVKDKDDRYEITYLQDSNIVDGYYVSKDLIDNLGMEKIVYLISQTSLDVAMKIIN